MAESTVTPPVPIPAPTRAPAPATPSLRSLAIRGSMWTMIGYGGGQVLRLAGNLVTTRLLVPEYFGIMALVQVWMQALEMFSDLGVNASIIQSPRGDDRDFCETGFTIQAIRGVGLWLLTSALAWPVAAFYGQPMLLALLPVAGFNAVLFGLTNVSLATHSRHMHLGRLTVLDTTVMAVQIGATVGLAWFWHSVWPLVLGGFAGTLLRLVASHTVLRIHRCRLRLDRESARELVRFGRWIMVSSILGFFVNRGDVLIIGKFVPAALLGVYHIGSMFATLVRQMYFRLANAVLFPVHVKSGDEPVESLRRKVFKVRVGVMALMLPPLWIFVVLGPQIIDGLYDARYFQAGEILSILAVGGVFTIVPDVGPIYLARGDSFLFMLSLTIRSALLLACMIVGALLAGLWGLVFGIVVSAALFYPVQVRINCMYRVWLPMLDAAGFAASAAAIWGGLWLVQVLGG